MLIDTPLIQDYIAKADRKRRLEGANAEAEAARRDYAARAGERTATGPDPAAPDLLSRSLQTLGSNLATALSGREMFAERTGASQMAEDRDFRAAQAAQANQRFQENLAHKADITAQARDAYLQKAQAARDIGNLEAEAEALEKAQKHAAALQEDEQLFRAGENALDRTQRMREIDEQIKGQIKIAKTKISRTGNPRIDAIGEWVGAMNEVDDAARQRYVSSTPKDKATTKGLQKFLATDAQYMRAKAMLDLMAEEVLKPGVDKDGRKQTPEEFGAILSGFGISKDMGDKIIKSNYTAAELRNVPPPPPPPPPALAAPAIGGIVGAGMRAPGVIADIATNTDELMQRAILTLLLGSGAANDSNFTRPTLPPRPRL